MLLREHAMMACAAHGPASAIMQFHRAAAPSCMLHSFLLVPATTGMNARLLTRHSHGPTCLLSPGGLWEWLTSCMHCLSCVCAGPGKSAVLYDEEGTEMTQVFPIKRNFEQWVRDNVIALVRDGRRERIYTWDALQDGGRYFSPRLLLDRVRSVNLPGVMVHSGHCMAIHIIFDSSLASP